MSLLLVDGHGILQTHGLGGATDLPIPFLYAMVGASWALTISFAVLALAWNEPRIRSWRPVITRRALLMASSPCCLDSHRLTLTSMRQAGQFAMLAYAVAGVIP